MIGMYSPLGIDISKAHFHVALLKGEKPTKYQPFTNDVEGFEQLRQWLAKPGIE